VSTAAGSAAEAGEPRCSFADGAGPAARLCRPLGLAVHTGLRNVEVYVADQWNNALRIVAAAAPHVVRTLVGPSQHSPTCVDRDGAAAHAVLCVPTYVASSGAAAFITELAFAESCTPIRKFDAATLTLSTLMPPQPRFAPNTVSLGFGALFVGGAGGQLAAVSPANGSVALLPAMNMYRLSFTYTCAFVDADAGALFVLGQTSIQRFSITPT
jgi:hypothetical protein